MGKREKVQELFTQLEEGVSSVYTSDAYKEYLSFISKFHHYSARNCYLIFKQMPTATLVAGFKAWKIKHNRHVKKGSQGISILGGNIRKYTETTINQETGKKEEKTGEYIQYFPCTVFDVSQTEGEDIPVLCEELAGEVKNFNTLFCCFESLSDFTVMYEEMKGGAKGYCAPQENRIAIKKGMSQTQILKTLIHEQAHALLHSSDEKTTSQQREVEAESVAFIVCSYLGLSTQDYSFPYIASWASNKEVRELLESQDVIQKEAHKIIEAVTAALNKKTAA